MTKSTQVSGIVSDNTNIGQLHIALSCFLRGNHINFVVIVFKSTDLFSLLTISCSSSSHAPSFHLLT